jgi:hypothetical protein
MQLNLNFLRRNLRIFLAGLLFLISFAGFAEDEFHAGPLFDQFSLTLDLGQRTEAAGPLFYSEQKDSESTWAFPPFFSHNVDQSVESREDDFLYPLLTFDRYGREYRWQLMQLLSFAGGQVPDDSSNKRFTIFPFYFQQRSPVTNENYTALFPIYGHINGRLFRDKIFFVLFPIYGQSQRRDVVTDNYLFPLFHLRHGDGLRGWQFWPLAGSRTQTVTTQTNGFGDVSSIPGHDNFFALWPVYFKSVAGVGTDDPEKFWAALPFYAQLRSPQRDSTSVLWPFFTGLTSAEKNITSGRGRGRL